MGIGGGFWYGGSESSNRSIDSCDMIAERPGGTNSISYLPLYWIICLPNLSASNCSTESQALSKSFFLPLLVTLGFLIRA